MTVVLQFTAEYLIDVSGRARSDYVDTHNRGKLEVLCFAVNSNREFSHEATNCLLFTNLALITD